MGKFKQLWRSLGGESNNEARERHRLLVSRLDRAGERGENLDPLRNCTADQPCRLEPCPLCVRWFRREYVRAFLKAGLGHGTFTRVSVILGGQFIPPGGFRSGWLTRLTGSARKQIERSELRDHIILGGVDLSLNVFENVLRWWAPHLYLLINEGCSDELTQAVQAAFRLDKEARYPVKAAAVVGTELLNCVTYSYKSGFYRRSSYQEPERPKVDGTPRRNVLSQSLSPAAQVDIARALADYSVGSRLIMRNVRRTTSPKADRVELKVLKPPLRA